MSQILRVKSVARKTLSPLRSYSTVKFPEAGFQPKQIQQKPQIRQFANPLLHAFLIASTTYIVLHSIWIRLEREEKEQVLTQRSKELEETIQTLLNQKKQELETSSDGRKWYKLWLWK
ncbi:uncharacterized protein RJT20DRAFT_54241 [Scheffersomyces xylosifermentans]|uniref:uncharacterized protein n=1 Tax=Scheffersomyces xylosifermentans TaxID=1304137 RepID=UPI00315DD94D